MKLEDLSLEKLKGLAREKKGHPAVKGFSKMGKEELTKTLKKHFKISGGSLAEKATKGAGAYIYSRPCHKAYGGMSTKGQCKTVGGSLRDIVKEAIKNVKGGQLPTSVMSKVMNIQAKGGKLSSAELHDMLHGSYNLDEYKGGNGWSRDDDLSTATSSVYRHDDGRAVVAHRGTEGTLSDWGNNLKYGSTGETGYKQTQRFKDAKDVQKKAEEKYGQGKISTIGHSQGGLLAELLGKNSHEIITVNKATSPFSDNSGGKNQHDIRSDCDKVSMFKTKKSKNDTTIKGKKNLMGCKDSVKEHSYDILKRKDDDHMFGHGLPLGADPATWSPQGRGMLGADPATWSPQGTGAGDDDIDFEDIKWGTFTKQLEAYNRQHKKNLDLCEFADMILKDTKKYQLKTVRRARFYKNVLAKKKCK